MHVYCIMNFHVIWKLGLVHHPPTWVKMNFPPQISDSKWEIVLAALAHSQVHPAHCVLYRTWCCQDWLKNSCFWILPVVCKTLTCSSCKVQNAPKIWLGRRRNSGPMCTCSEQSLNTGKSFPNTAFPFFGRSQFSSWETWILFYSIRQMVSYLQIPIF